MTATMPKPSDSPAPQEPAAAGPAKRQSTAKTLLGVGSGNAMEWFDWGIYAVFAPFFAAQFFHTEDAASSLLKTLAVFAVGFVARPFGGIFFGWLSDRLGRKSAMSWTVALGAGGSLLIGLTPNYATIGVAASVLLVIARLAQGLAHGGELPAAQTYIAEEAPRERRGLWSSIIYVSGTVGQLAALVLAGILASSLSDDAMHSWGWRIAFVLGGVFGFYSLYMRTRLEESEIFEGHKAARGSTDAPKRSVFDGVRRHPKLLLQICGMVLGMTVLYYAWAVSAPAYAIAVIKVPKADALWAGAGAQLVFLALCPLWGRLSDRVGRKPVMISAAVAIVALTFPLNAMLTPSAWSLFAAMSLAMVPLSALASVTVAVYAEIFPTNIRTLGLALPYALCVAAFGGTAPYLQTYFGSLGRPEVFLGYAMALGVVSIITMCTVPETRAKDLTA
ncbi:MFS transporter [Tsukamurella sp. NPDC003166]|uniref:MFS transporter n=1 Tax=Tsukamurella sp. NPDC003166 TaxID=3154444 RepID=UPI0033BDA24F